MSAKKAPKTPLPKSWTRHVRSAAIGATTIDHTDGGTFDFSGGTLTVDTFQGSLTQDGGILAPGSSPGNTIVTGDYTMNAGSLEVEIAGLVQGAEFDFLDVAGNVSLGGALQLSLISPFTFSPGQSFEIIDVGGLLSGTFSGLAEGDFVGGFGSANLAVTYAGGDGNDVALLAVLPGDFDVDGDVDGLDFLAWQRGESPNPLSQSDLNDWQTNFGTVAPLVAATAAVPEPSSLLLGALAGSIFIFLRYRS